MHMVEKGVSSGDSDLAFDNKTVRVVAVKDMSEVKLTGITVGPYEEGREYEEKRWVANELVKAGIARFKADEKLDFNGLNKVHWTEIHILQSGRQFSVVPQDFYPKLQRYLVDLKRRVAKEPGELERYNKSLKLARDIIDYRSRKVVTLASSPIVGNDILQPLTTEERSLYDRLRDVISTWRSTLLILGEEGE